MVAVGGDEFASPVIEVDVRRLRQIGAITPQDATTGRPESSQRHQGGFGLRRRRLLGQYDRSAWGVHHARGHGDAVVVAVCVFVVGLGVEGVVLVDDSIVRGSTTRQLVTMVREAGATDLVEMPISKIVP